MNLFLLLRVAGIKASVAKHEPRLPSGVQAGAEGHEAEGSGVAQHQPGNGNGLERK